MENETKMMLFKNINTLVAIEFSKMNVYSAMINPAFGLNFAETDQVVSMANNSRAIGIGVGVTVSVLVIIIVVCEVVILVVVKYFKRKRKIEISENPSRKDSTDEKLDQQQSKTATSESNTFGALVVKYFKRKGKIENGTNPSSKDLKDEKRDQQLSKPAASELNIDSALGATDTSSQNEAAGSTTSKSSSRNKATLISAAPGAKSTTSRIPPPRITIKAGTSSKTASMFAASGSIDTASKPSKSKSGSKGTAQVKPVDSARRNSNAGGNSKRPKKQSSVAPLNQDSKT